MCKGSTYLLSLIGCFAFFSGRTQNLDSLPPVTIQDSVYETPVSQNENYQFKEVEGQGEIRTRKVPARDLDRLRSDKDYWYVDQAPPRDRETSDPEGNQKGKKKKEEQPSRGLFNIPWLNALFWFLLIGGFTALLVWFLKTSNIQLFRRKAAPLRDDIPEELSQNIFEMNFESEIQRAIDAGDPRLAVRLMYLRTLRDLSDRGLIRYTREKTNSDYLIELAGTPYYKNFFRLTRNFDYTWYGQFDVSPEGFGIIQNDFSSFKQQLS